MGGDREEGDEDDEEESDESEEESDAEWDAMLDDPELTFLQASRLPVLDEVEALPFLTTTARAVVHLCDPALPLSADVELHLETLTARFPGTAFVRIVPSRAFAAVAGGPAATVAPLRRFLGVRRLGALVALRGGAAVAAAENLAAFAEGGRVVARKVDAWLARTGVLSSEAAASGGSGDAAGGATAAALRDEAGEAEFYDCGRAGCQKTFRHEHVSSALPVSFFKPLPAPEATRSSLGPAQLRPEM